MVPSPAAAEVGDLMGVGNDPNGQPVRPDFGHGQAHAVDGDGAFHDDVAHEFGRRNDAEVPVGAALLEDVHPSRAIDVAGDEMAMDTAVREEGSLQIDEGAGLEELEVGAGPGFAQEIEAQGFTAVGLHDGKAAAVDGDALADLCALSAGARAQGEFDRFLALAHELDGSRFFDNSSEHIQSRRAVRSRSRPAIFHTGSSSFNP